jgi:hypothetical protein
MTHFPYLRRVMCVLVVTLLLSALPGITLPIRAQRSASIKVGGVVANPFHGGFGSDWRLGPGFGGRIEGRGRVYYTVAADWSSHRLDYTGYRTTLAQDLERRRELGQGDPPEQPSVSGGGLTLISMQAGVAFRQTVSQGTTAYGGIAAGLTNYREQDVDFYGGDPAAGRDIGGSSQGTGLSSSLSLGLQRPLFGQNELFGEAAYSRALIMPSSLGWWTVRLGVAIRLPMIDDN